MKKDNIALNVSDCILGRPYGFKVDDERFYLYPQSLGKFLLLQKVMESMDVNVKLLQNTPAIEALRLANLYRENCIRIIVYNTCRTREEVFDEDLFEKRSAIFEEKLSAEDLAALMMTILTAYKKDDFEHHFGIDKDMVNLKRAMSCKSNGNTLAFGGKSIFGTLLDVACERYKWTKDYVVWGIDYTSLQLMLNDKVTTLFFSDEEKRKLPLSILEKDSDTIVGKKENMEQIRNMDWR